MFRKGGSWGSRKRHRGREMDRNPDGEERRDAGKGAEGAQADRGGEKPLEEERGE